MQAQVSKIFSSFRQIFRESSSHRRAGWCVILNLSAGRSNIFSKKRIKLALSVLLPILQICGNVDPRSDNRHVALETTYKFNWRVRFYLIHHRVFAMFQRQLVEPGSKITGLPRVHKLQRPAWVRSDGLKINQLIFLFAKFLADFLARLDLNASSGICSISSVKIRGFKMFHFQSDFQHFWEWCSKFLLVKFTNFILFKINDCSKKAIVSFIRRVLD